MQTQQLLAAVQAQAKLANSGPPSLMGSAPYGRNGGRMMNQQRGGRFNRNDRPRQGVYNRRDDRKRRYSPPPRPFKRERKDGDNAARFIHWIPLPYLYCVCIGTGQTCHKFIISEQPRYFTLFNWATASNVKIWNRIKSFEFGVIWCQKTLKKLSLFKWTR